MAVLTRAEAIAEVTATGTYELVERDIRGVPCRVFVNAPQNLHALFNSNRSDNEFYIYENERYTFEDMYQRGAKLGRFLVDGLGIEKGDRVAISLRNYPEWVIAFEAVTSIGGIAMCMNALWEADELEYGLLHGGAKAIVADQERLDRVAQCNNLGELKVITVRSNNVPEGSTPIADILSSEETDMPNVDVSPDDDATILYTSGSTGHPKGVVSSHRNVISALFSWELDGAVGMHMLRKRLESEGKEVPTAEPPPYPPAMLLGVPLFHVAGSHAVMLQSFRSQRKIVAMYKWNAEKGAELIEQERISAFTAPAAMTGDMIEVAKKTDRDLSSLRSVGGGGAPRAPEQVKNLAKTFGSGSPGTGWGMTETNAIGTGIGGEDYLNHPESSGKCSPVLDMRIMDDEGNLHESGVRGELLIRGSSMFREYWDRPDANDESFIDGWFRTGDVATIDEEGYLYIVDRIKQLVIRGGENISCGEVEAAILEHPDVMEASVYGVPDERMGEEVGVSLFAKGDLSEDELSGFLVSRLAKFKIPKYYRFSSDALPRIASGKINKRSLREEAVKEIVGE
ncbi:MAG: fatty acid--CoA ligase [Gammaproteobacteria bacterium TMED34]|nr:MAG: fatty acid--CoA ligase [Gammaproteobacteria bacterium TMED34]